MEIVPRSVGVVSRSWDEQHLDLAAAAEQVAAAPAAGFSPGVLGAAERFTTAWERHCAGLGRASESRADALRAVVRDHLAADAATAADFVALAPYRVELR